MTKILAFDSVYIINPIRWFYIQCVKRLLVRRADSLDRIILYRLDRENRLVRNNRNLSATPTGIDKNEIDALSIKFYRYLNDAGSFSGPTIKGIDLYQLYTRQVKLKLSGVLQCAYRLRYLSEDGGEFLEVVTDRQTISIMQFAFKFLEWDANNITWISNRFLTFFVSVNALVMRTIAIAKMSMKSSTLPDEYFYRHASADVPTVVVTLPFRRPDAFFCSYVKKFKDDFNVIIYSMGSWGDAPDDFVRKKVVRSKGSLQGIFSTNTLLLSAESYLTDILLIFYDHANLSISIDIVDSIYVNKVDAHVSRLQTNVVDNYLAIAARERGVFVLGDIMEEVFYCDAAVFPSKSKNNMSAALAVKDQAKVVYKGADALIRYRLAGFEEDTPAYLSNLLRLDGRKDIIFYASDPSKDESQRYETERFLIDCFSRIDNAYLVIKTHPQDVGRITDYAYRDANLPSSVFLIGDALQKRGMASELFKVFENFNFNSAVQSSDGFLTTSSSSILQAVVLGQKVGIVDKFMNGNYDYLINNKAAMRIVNEQDIHEYLKADAFEIPEAALQYCGLEREDSEFDVSRYLLLCLKELETNKAVEND